MTEPARAMSRDSALAELSTLHDDKLILLEGTPTATRVSLDGWDPFAQAALDGCVAGVVVKYLESGSRLSGAPSGGSAPNDLDPRNALALVRLCEWLRDTYSVTELYHLGIAGGGVDRNGNPRVDCHGQGRAVDFVGVRGGSPDDGSEFVLTVQEDWGKVGTGLTPGGSWPAGAATSFRLDDPAADPFARDFFQASYDFIASQWQDRSTGPDGEDVPTTIGQGSFIMNPDHPSSAPGTPNGREAHANHLHMQIGVTGTAVT